MKTAMQELIDWLNKHGDNRIYGGRELTVHQITNKARAMLEKEKEVIIKAAADHCYPTCGEARRYAEDYYNETFNTKER